MMLVDVAPDPEHLASQIHVVRPVPHACVNEHASVLKEIKDTVRSYEHHSLLGHSGPHLLFLGNYLMAILWSVEGILTLA